jgi:hypothetical protein
MNAQIENAQKAKVRADEHVPGELWMEVFPGIFVASGRNPRSERQVQVLETELEQARILAAQGHTVYLLPEQGPRGEKHPDAIVDGLIMEFKTITGNIRKIGENYKSARVKAENVFLRIIPDYTKEAVQRKLKGTIINKGYNGGLIVVHFNVSGKMYYWNVDDLK